MLFIVDCFSHSFTSCHRKPHHTCWNYWPLPHRSASDLRVLTSRLWHNQTRENRQTLLVFWSPHCGIFCPFLFKLSAFEALKTHFHSEIPFIILFSIHHLCPYISFTCFQDVNLLLLFVILRCMVNRQFFRNLAYTELNSHPFRNMLSTNSIITCLLIHAISFNHPQHVIKKLVLQEPKRNHRWGTGGHKPSSDWIGGLCLFCFAYLTHSYLYIHNINLLIINKIHKDFHHQYIKLTKVSWCVS